MKRTYKLTPVSQYDVAGLESWLEDMARKGLYLKKFRPLFCTFTRGEPKATRCRLEPHKRALAEGPPQSMVELYRDFGWDCAGAVGGDMLLFTTQDMEAEELHTDPQLQGEMWHKLVRSVRRRFLVLLLLLFLLLALVAVSLFGDGTPVLALVTSSVPPALLLCLYVAACLPAFWLDLRRLSRMSRRMESGAPMDHRVDYPKRRPAALLSFLVLLAIYVLAMATQYILPLTGGGLRPLEELEGFTPLSLSALEGEGFEAVHPIAGNGVDYGNFCERERYLLCWDQWRVVQSGPDQLGPLVRLEIQWYDPLLNGLAAPLAREQLTWYLDEENHLDFPSMFWYMEASDRGFGPWTVAEYPMAGVDYLAVARRGEDRFQLAAVAAQGKTAVVRYTGHGDLADHLEELAAMVTG